MKLRFSEAEGEDKKKKSFTSVKTKTLFISVLKGCGKCNVLTKGSTLFCEETKQDTIITVCIIQHVTANNAFCGNDKKK